ncbi:hypothetical protein M573_126006 [Prevotella intermedia ZT]|uniref:Uncharacterized protein n=1 Tax=Prevotella intermedia ZT TaxID=1347790 RepID=A0AAP0YSW7_PREIN|nr:hypothetical protein [Prevotella intermedia]KJJ86402.1 hypothetical protein M573_126006 [Prevotella intermedia ZT]
MAGERNYARFYALLKQLPHADKDTLVWQYTQGRTKSLKEASKWEYDVMCRDMERVVNNDNKVALKQAALRKARSGVLHQLQIYGLDTTDWATVDAFCQNLRIAGKLFRELTITELNEVNKKIRVIIKKQKEKENGKSKS